MSTYWNDMRIDSVLLFLLLYRTWSLTDMPNIFTCQTNGKLCAGTAVAAAVAEAPIIPLSSSSSSSSSTLSSFIENLHSSHVMTFQKFWAKTYLIININKKTISVSCVAVPGACIIDGFPVCPSLLFGSVCMCACNVTNQLDKTHWCAFCMCSLCFAQFVYFGLRLKRCFAIFNWPIVRLFVMHKNACLPSRIYTHKLRRQWLTFSFVCPSLFWCDAYTIQ